MPTSPRRGPPAAREAILRKCSFFFASLFVVVGFMQRRKEAKGKPLCPLWLRCVLRVPYSSIELQSVQVSAAGGTDAK